jgi:hypothetical protein
LLKTRPQTAIEILAAGATCDFSRERDLDRSAAPGDFDHAGSGNGPSNRSGGRPALVIVGLNYGVVFCLNATYLQKPNCTFAVHPARRQHIKSDTVAIWAGQDEGSATRPSREAT